MITFRFSTIIIIIESIVNKHGSDNARKMLQDYIQAFNSFCQRSIFEVPGHIFCTSRKMARVLVFKHTETEGDRIEEINRMIGNVASIFELQPSALQLCSVKKGCVELHFLISAAVADHIFPVSPSQDLALNEMGVKVLSCDKTVNNESEVCMHDDEISVFCFLLVWGQGSFQ